MAGLDPGSSFSSFIEDTGTGGFPHLNDESGELWLQFGATDRSTFLFVSDDGTFVQTSFGEVDEARLVSEVQRLIDT